MAALVRQGWRTRYVLCTSGEKGTDDPTEAPERVAARREEEQRAARQAVGAAAPIFPRLPYTTHRDHRIEGRVALDAAYPYARDPLYFPEQLRDEGLQPHTVLEAWLFSSDQPGFFVDIAAGLGAKIAARLAHASQTRDPQALAAVWRRRTEGQGGLALAEAFTRVLMREPPATGSSSGSLMAPWKGADI